MNLTTHVVTEVLSQPENDYNRWHVRVKANSYGHIQETIVSVKTKEEADKIKAGYKYEA